LAGLIDTEVAVVMGWSVDQVSGTRRTYVDQSRVVVAMGERTSQGGVNRTVKRGEAAEKYRSFSV
jgi:coenzyme F420-reducing hydrogenase gamma subunit